MKKKITTLLAVFMMALCLCLGGRTEKTVEAAAKATLSSKKEEITGVVPAYLYIKNCKPNALYTYTISNEKVIKVEELRYFVFEKNEIGFMVAAGEKAGTAKITIKEKIGKKERTVGSCTIKNKKKTNDFYASESMDVPKGCKFNLEASGYAKIPEKVSYSSSNPSVASVAKDGTITTKKAGSAVIKMKKGSKTCQLTLNVSNTRLEEKYSNLVKEINALAAKKITKSNLSSYYKKYMSINERYWKYRRDEGVEIPLLKDPETIHENLRKYLVKTKKLTILSSDESVQLNHCLDIAKLTFSSSSKTVKIELKKKLTKEDIMMINLEAEDKNFAKDFEFRYDYEPGSINIYQGSVNLSLKAGKKTLTGKSSGIRKGQVYYYRNAVISGKKGSFKLYSVKAK